LQSTTGQTSTHNTVARILFYPVYQYALKKDFLPEFQATLAANPCGFFMPEILASVAVYYVGFILKWDENGKI
jgi:hypothetical protein